MKNLFFAVATLFAFTASAQKNLEISNLPEPALSFIETHFAGIPVTKVKADKENGDKGYEVTLSNGTEIEFRSDGSYRGVDGNHRPIPTAFIDPKIMNYVTENYPQSKITHIDYDRKSIEVELGNIDLEFSTDGRLISASN